MQNCVYYNDTTKYSYNVYNTPLPHIRAHTHIHTHRRICYTNILYSNSLKYECVWQCKRRTWMWGQKERTPSSLSLHSQSANTKHRGEEKKGNYNRQEEEKQQFWQSCVDNFPGADLAKEATSVELPTTAIGVFGLL